MKNKTNRYLVHVELGAEEFDLTMPLTPEQLSVVRHDYEVDTEELWFANWERLSGYVNDYLQDNPLYYDLKDMLHEYSVFATMDNFEPIRDYFWYDSHTNHAHKLIKPIEKYLIVLLTYHAHHQMPEYN